MRSGQIKAAAHITGGGLLENIPRVLSKNVAVELDMAACRDTTPAVFPWLARLANLTPFEMTR